MAQRQMRAAVGIGLEWSDWGERVSFVTEAERLGVHAAWSSEAWGADAVSPLGFLAARTSHVLLGTSIVQVGSRSPALLGMTAGTLHSITDGRFILGLGVSGPQVIEGWHGVPFRRPVERMREAIAVIRLVLSGERVQYEGQSYRLPLPGGEGTAIRSSMGPQGPVPIYLATLGPRSLEMTGEIADGWLASSFIPQHAGVFTAHLRAGAERAGRRLEDLELQAGGVVAFGDDLARLIEPRRRGLAFELGAMGSRAHNFYNQAYQRAGYQDVAREIQRRWLDGDRAGATALVPDDLVTGTNLLGTEAMVTERIRAYRDAGITTIMVEPDGDKLAARLDTLGRFMRLLEQVNGEGA